MKNRSLFLMIFFYFLLMAVQVPTLLIAQARQPKKIIYETDMCLDVDDVGGLAILHAMANMGEAEILAVSFNEVHPYGVAAIDAINTWYGRGNIPIGCYKGNLSNPDGSGYLAQVAKFPHDLEKEAAPSSLDLYRQILAQQPDSSVTIVSVGFLNNLNDLLIAEPDLVARKVKELVQMAGLNNDGFNLPRHNLVAAAQNVIKNWPTPLVISHEGGSILTADNLQNAPLENPVREAFFRFFGGRYGERSSWDEMAVLYGVRGLGANFNNISIGSGSIGDYTWPLVRGFRSHLTNRYSDQTYVKIIEDLMDQLPTGAHFNASLYSGWLPFSVDFDASESNVGGNRSVQHYLWDFGDGESGEGEKVTHIYTAAGLNEVRLRVIDDLGDTLRTSDQIRVSNPVFSPIGNFGNILSYERNQEALWSTQMDSNDLRYFISNESRRTDISKAGFCFIKDSTYTDFNLNLIARTGENLSQNSLADYSIMFGYENDSNYNQILMKPTTSRLTNYSNGQSTSLAWTTQKGIPDQGYHQIRVDFSGDKLTVAVDDSVILTSTSARLKKNGKVGFGSGQFSVFFDDIKVTRYGSPSSVHFQESLPLQFSLSQNYPNPFNPSTKVAFTLPNTENVKIELFNSIGQKVGTLIDTTLPAGSHQIDFNGQNLFSGVYLYQIEAGSFKDVKKMILMK